MTELTILMPCLNEAETLAVCIDKAQAYLDRAGIAGEVLIADNGSTDGSQGIARAHGARVVDVAQKGYGAALIAGIEAAKGRFVIMGDSDDSYDFSTLDPFVAELRDGAQLVMGNRFRGGIARQAMPPLHRYLGNPVLSFVGRVLYRAPVGDFHCGLRGFDRAAIRSLRLNAPGMEFASEMVIKATLTGLRVTEVPTTLSPDGRSRPPHLRSWRDGWLHLKLLLTFAPFWMFFYPGLALAGTGALAFGALMFGPVQLGSVTLDVGTLILASALILVGYQLICFYGLARLFAVRFGLIPARPQDAVLRRRISVDRACLVGAAALVVAAVAFGVALSMWARADFGDLAQGAIVRPVALSVVAAAIGVQTIVTGFLWGLMEQRIEPAVRDRAMRETLLPLSR